MLVESTSTNAAGVTGAIRQAAGTTGANFQYLLATAQIESGLNPNSKASTSSATGLFQFIDQTWLATMKDAGGSLGYGKYADAITRTRSGRLYVKDPAMRAEIMGLRKDPTANALMAGAFTKQNAARLRTKIGREPTDGELYMAHFLGANGASKLITAAARNPDAKAVSLFPRAARSNNSIFYDRQGNARTVSQVYGVLVHKLDVARARTSPTPAPEVADAPSTAAPQAAARTAATPRVASPKASPPMAAAATAAKRRPVLDATVPRLLPGAMHAVRTVSFLPGSGSTYVQPVAATPAPAAASAPGIPPANAPSAVDATASALAAAPPDNSAAPVAPVRAASFAPETSPSPVFLDLFRTEGRQGVSSAVSELWSAPLRANAPAAIAATAVVPAGNAGDANTNSRQAPGPPLDLLGTGQPQRPRIDRRS